MTLSNREKWLLTLLPAFVILAVAGWFFIRPVSEQNKKAQDQLAEMTSGQQSAGHLAQSRRELAEARRAVDAEQSRLDSLRSELRQKQAVWSGRKNIVASTDLVDLLTRHRLVLVEESDVSPAELALSNTMRSVMNQLSDGDANRYRQMRIVGSYANVLAALTELSESSIACIPLRLSMDRANPQVSARGWTLVVWI